MSKLRFILPALVLATAIASLLMHRRAQVELQANDALSRQRNSQVAALIAENQQLSNWVAQVRSNPTTVHDEGAEVTQLRAKAQALRQETEDLAKQVAKERLSAGVQVYASGDYTISAHNNVLGATLAGGPRADSAKLNDARVLTAALRKYADKHQGQFPLSLELVSAYLPKPLQPDSPSWENAPLSGTNDFEIVFQGTQNDLSDIPPRRVALIRERLPWPAASGKMARAYGYADGAADLVESDDNFQSWDAQHIVPAGVAGR